MALNKKAYAVGHFIMTCVHLTNQRGGKQKLQKIVGKRIFYESEIKGQWMFRNPVIAKMTIAQLNNLAEKVKKA